MKSSNIVFETESDKSSKKGADKEFYINSENRGYFPYPQNPFPRTNNNVSPFFGKESERIEDWLYIVELVLEGNNVTQDKQKIIFATSYLRDAALHEYQSFVKNKDRDTISWEEFKIMLKDRYKRKDHELFMREKLRNLKQHKDLSQYINDFRIILNQISNISEFDQITYFMNGLNDLTSDYVRLKMQKITIDLKTIEIQKIMIYSC